MVEKVQQIANQCEDKRMKFDEASFDIFFSTLVRLGDLSEYYFKSYLDKDVSKTPPKNKPSSARVEGKEKATTSSKGKGKTILSLHSSQAIDHHG